jgi:large subunit ribosomal protein L32e
MSASTKKTAAAKGGKDLLAIKRRLRAARPKFQFHANHRKARLRTSWRKPRGLHNKQKDEKRGSMPKPSDGWRTPPEVRGQHTSGLAIVRVTQASQLEGIDAQSQGVVIASVGAKRQRELLGLCIERKIRVLNHNAQERIKFLDQRRADAQARLAAARKAKEQAAKAAEKASQTKKDEAVLSEEEKKEQQDKIKEEVLKHG